MEDLSRDVVSPVEATVLSGSTNRYGSVPVRRSSGSERLLRDTEYSSIVDVLGENRRNVRRSAEMLGIARSTLYEKIRKFGIDVGNLR